MMSKKMMIGVKVAKKDVDKIDELAEIKTTTNPDGVKITRSDIARKWISEGLERDYPKKNLNAPVKEVATT